MYLKIILSGMLLISFGVSMNCEYLSGRYNDDIKDELILRNDHINSLLKRQDYDSLFYEIEKTRKKNVAQPMSYSKKKNEFIKRIKEVNMWVTWQNHSTHSCYVMNSEGISINIINYKTISDTNLVEVDTLLHYWKYSDDTWYLTKFNSHEVVPFWSDTICKVYNCQKHKTSE